MKSTKYHIGRADVEHVPGIMKLLNEHLFTGSATAENTQELISNGTCYIAADRIGSVVGFVSLYQIQDMEKELLGHTDVLEVVRSLGDHEYATVGHLVLAPSARQSRAGYLLFQEITPLFQGKKVLFVGWKHAGGWEAEFVARRIGCITLMEKENFWYEESVQHGYICPVCGEGCHCTAVISVRV